MENVMRFFETTYGRCNSHKIDWNNSRFEIHGNDVIVCRKNGIGTLVTGSHITLTSANTWTSASSLITQSFGVGDTLEIMLISSSGFPTQISVQVDFIR